MLSPTTSRFTRLFAAGAALVGVALATGACNKSSSGTTTTSTSGSTTSTPGGSSTPTTKAAGGSSASTLAAFKTKLQAGTGASFVATYTLQGTTLGSNEKDSWTIAQAGGKTLFRLTHSSNTSQVVEAISGGTSGTVCSEQSAGAAWQCFSGSIAQDLAKSLDVLTTQYGAKAALSDFDHDELGATGTTESTKTFAGQSASCITYHLVSSAITSWTYCVLGSGVLAAWYYSAGSSNWSLTLSSYSSSVPSNEFTPPATPSTLP